MKKLILLLALSTTLNYSFGQAKGTSYFLNEVSMSASGSTIEVTEDGDTILVSDYSGQNLSLNVVNKFVKKYRGTPYFGNKWFQGSVTLDGSEPSVGLIGFNVVKNVVYYSPDKNTEVIELKPKTFSLDGLIFRNYENEYQGANRYYYNILVDGEPILLKQHSGKYTETSDKVEAAYGNARTIEYSGKFEKFENYYFVVQKKLVKVSHKKSFIRSMGPYENKVRQIIAENKLNLKNSKDIVLLARILNN